MAPRTRENRRIAFLAVWSFGGAQFSTFLDGNNLQDDGTEAEPVCFGCISLCSERGIYKERDGIFKLAEFMAFLTASYCLTLSAVKSMFSYSV